LELRPSDAFFALTTQLTHAYHTAQLPTQVRMGDTLDDGFEAYDLEADAEEFADDDEVSQGRTC